MKLLLDSHFCFWLALRRERLAEIELSVILEPENDLAFPSIAIWELRIKWEKRFVSGERKGEANPSDVLNYLRHLGLPAIDLSPEIAATELREPIGHSDPFDELMLVIAQETDRLLFTRDARLRGHPLAYYPG